MELQELEKKQGALMSLDLTKWTEEKEGLSYVSWSYAWAKFLKVFPQAVYEVVEDSNGLPYFGDGDVGFIVKTKVFPNGLNGFFRSMWLPVMDSKNKTMMRTPYSYTVKKWDKFKKKWEIEEKKVAAVTMFDINKTIMRCLVKNLAMFGLGIYVYAGEDLPDALNDDVCVSSPQGAISEPVEEAEKDESKEQPKAGKALTAFQRRKIETAKTMEELKLACRKLVDGGADLKEVKELFNSRAVSLDVERASVREQAYEESGIVLTNEQAEKVAAQINEKTEADNG